MVLLRLIGKGMILAHTHAGPTARGTPAGASCPSTPPELPSSIAGVSVPDPDLDPLVR